MVGLLGEAAEPAAAPTVGGISGYTDTILDTLDKIHQRAANTNDTMSSDATIMHFLLYFFIYIHVYSKTGNGGWCVCKLGGK